jgi:hypothetical protein
VFSVALLVCVLAGLLQFLGCVGDIVVDRALRLLRTEFWPWW